MSGHSKWHNIQKRKGAVDAKKGQAFSKIAKMISIAAKEGGGDQATNFSLRLAVEKAKEVNMPKENIERAIARGTGTGSETVLEPVVYEGMGPGGAAILVEAVTDNKSRTYGNVRNIFTKFGANMEARVLWMFDHKGLIRVSDMIGAPNHDEVELSVIDAGAEDVRIDDEIQEIICPIPALLPISEIIKKAGFAIEEAIMTYLPKNPIELSSEDEEKLGDFIELLETDDDVTGVHTNAA
ncbi:MAG: YebC/PmpR family DNA-binding transcriptional regulator [Patescibacteria group bacterium]|jgi:YebC/PmpR family DNA-binding regulatory protein